MQSISADRKREDEEKRLDFLFPGQGGSAAQSKGAHGRIIRVDYLTLGLCLLMRFFLLFINRNERIGVDCRMGKHQCEILSKW